MITAHDPVLLNEAMEYLDLKRKGTWVDATLGLGGHSAEILKRISPGSDLIGIDADGESLEAARKNIGKRENFRAVKSDFRNITDVLDRTGIKTIAGILYDLGVSSLHFDSPERGFSFSHDGPLDMRIDRDGALTAYQVVNRYSEKDLRRIIRDYGEERMFKRAAAAIIRNRPVETTARLAEIIAGAKKTREKINPATRVFQAVRIEVNGELEAIKESLERVLERIEEKGRIVVISFHSLEDRIVKRFFSRESRDCVCEDKRAACVCGHKRSLKVLTKKPVTPRDEEVSENPRARSSKLRAAEKL